MSMRDIRSIVPGLDGGKPHHKVATSQLHYGTLLLAVVLEMSAKISSFAWESGALYLASGEPGLYEWQQL